jgi:GNAT superfamily N-acetyltransferase
VSEPRFKIERAQTTTDIAACAELFRAYESSLGIDLAYQDFEQELAALPGKYAPPSGQLLLARAAEGELIGCVALRPLELDGCCEMKRLYVSPEGRGCGLGKALVNAIIEEAKRIGYREIRLDTLPTMVEAISLYQKCGFLPIPPYNEAPFEGVVYMGRQLTSD